MNQSMEGGAWKSCESEMYVGTLPEPLPPRPSPSQPSPVLASGAPSKAGARATLGLPPRRKCRTAAPTRPPSNSMYDTPYQLSLVWRATVPLSDCWVQHYSGRGERVALSVACCWCVWRDGVLARWRVRRRRLGGVRRAACRAPGPAPPSRTTRTDIWCTGPDMSWERDVRVHTIPLTLVYATHDTHHTTPHNTQHHTTQHSPDTHTYTTRLITQTHIYCHKDEHYTLFNTLHLKIDDRNSEMTVIVTSLTVKPPRSDLNHEDSRHYNYYLLWPFYFHSK